MMAIDVASLSLKDAMTLLEREVYQASGLLEQLEFAGKISGNGHHARQEVARRAKEELRKRWLVGRQTTNNTK